MSQHGQRHERLLEALMNGDRRAEEPELRELLAGCGDCRVALEELRAVSGLLDQAAREEQATLAGLDEAGEPPGSELVAPFFQARMAEVRAGPGAAPASGAPRGRLLRFTRLQFTAAAAAAVIGLGWLARLWIAPEGGDRHGEGPETMLGGARDQARNLKAEPGYASFSWKYGGLGNGSFVLRFWDADVPADAEPLHQVLDCLDHSWTPEDAGVDTKPWPDHVRWTVEVVDGSGKLVGERAVETSDRH